MVKAEEYKGIEFVRISKLPADEANQISEWSRRKKFTILLGDKMLRDCIQFRHYKEWYENNYEPSPELHEALNNEKISMPAPKRNFTLGFMRSWHFFTEKN